MIEYWKKEKERPVLEGTLQQAEAEVQTARRKAALGMLSQPELLEAEAAVCTAQAAEASGKTKQEELRRQLIVMTGWQYDDMPRLGEIPIPEEALPVKNRPGVRPNTGISCEFQSGSRPPQTGKYRFRYRKGCA